MRPSSGSSVGTRTSTATRGSTQAADRAAFDVRKLRDYVLSAASERGRHKARVFARVLGIGSADARWLWDRILDGIRNADATLTARSRYGAFYRADIRVETERGAATVRTAWIVRTGETFPRLTTCFVL